MTFFPTTVLVATDGSTDAALAVGAAADLAARTGSTLHLAHVRERHLVGGQTLYAQSEALADRVLDEAAAGITAHGGTVGARHLPSGHPVDALLSLAAELQPGLFVLGTRGHGSLRRLLLGSVATGIVHHAHFPVLVVRGGEHAWPPARVIIGDDGSAEAGEAGTAAAAVAAVYAAPVLVVQAMPAFVETVDQAMGAGSHVAEDVLTLAQETLDDRVRDLSASLPKNARNRLAFAEPAAALLDVAAEETTAALIAVGSRGLGPRERLRFGSVSTRVLHGAHCPVLVTPGHQPRASSG